MESRLSFRLMYLIGLTPWDTGVTPPELVEVIEGEAALKPGRALDLGCGTGTNVVYLAKHGWEVTGVDFTPRAVRKARRKASSAGAKATILVGDVTRLDQAGVKGHFQLLLDVGCFHGIPSDRRAAYASGIAAVAEPGASYLLFAFTEPRGPRPGVPREDVEATFARDWELVHAKIDPPPGAGAWYRFGRR